MRGVRHSLRLIGMRQQTAPNTGKPIRDSEGRWKRSPATTEDVRVVEVEGFIGYPNRSEGGEGESITNAAHLPLGTTVEKGDELEAYGLTGRDAILNGRYEIVGVGTGRVMVRVTLRRMEL